MVIEAIERLNKTPVGGILRTLGLWVLILGATSMLFWLYATGQFVWMEVIAIIALWIGYKEIWGVFVGYPDPDNPGQLKKMTISTAYKLYIQRVGRIGYIPLALFWLAMTGLVVHLAFWGEEKKEK